MTPSKFAKADACMGVLIAVMAVLACTAILLGFGRTLPYVAL